MKGFGFLAALAATALLASRSPAQAAPVGDATPTAVLGLEALDGAPDSIASDITDALRQRVASTPTYQLVQGKDLVEVKLVFSCPDEAPACMAAAGKSMGASKLIFGNVKRDGADYQVTLKLLDVGRAAVESFATETIARRKAESQAFRALAPAWLSRLTGKGAGGTLQIRASVPGASVSLDGTHVGVTGTSPVVVPDVAPGRHEVEVEKEGYTTTKQEFSLATGQNLPLSLSLSPLSADVSAIPTGETPPVLVHRPDVQAEPDSGGGGSRTTSRAAFWVAVVGTLTATGLGIKFAKDVEQINSDLDKYRRVQPGTGNCPATSTSACDLQGKPAPDLSASDYSQQASKVSQGHRDTTYEAVSFAFAGAFAIAGGYFLYRGYLDSGGETATTASRGLRIFPTASASAGGIVTEFDF
ncbi:MAG TPA: PEGA domain-containing protein [Polyangia bacterium]|nr:PEGA domain-containing protein [Polyangia bacterium]